MNKTGGSKLRYDEGINDLVMYSGRNYQEKVLKQDDEGRDVINLC